MRRLLQSLFVVFLILLVPTFLAAQTDTISNQDIIVLTENQLDEIIIVEKIRSSNVAFDLSTEGLVRLKKAGVTTAVFSAMFEAQRRAKPTPPPVDPPPSAVAIRPAPVVSAPAPDPTPATSIISRDVVSSPPAVSSIRPSAQSTTAAAAVDPACLKANLDKATTDRRLRFICDLVRVAVAQDPTDPPLTFDNAATLLLDVFVGEVVKRNKLFTTDAERSAAAADFFLEAEKKRTDKQVGSTPGSAGTTSLVVKGGAPSLIGWAVERGAATSSISGDTVTVRINPLGLFRAFRGEGFLGRNFLAKVSRDEAAGDGFEDALRKVSAAFSFDTTRGNETPIFIVSKQQLSAVSVRYEFINQRTPQSRRAQNLFRAFVRENTPIFNNLGNLVDSLEDDQGNFKNRALQDWLVVTNNEIRAVADPVGGRISEIRRLLAAGRDRLDDIRALLNVNDDKLREILNLINLNDDRVRELIEILDPVAQRNYKEAVRTVIERRLEVFPVQELMNDVVVKQAFERFADLSLDYEGKRNAFVQEVNKGAVATFEYTNFREVNAPDSSNFRFVWEKGLLGNVDFTVNASLTVFHERPLGMNTKRIKDFQFAGQADIPIKNTLGFGDTVLSFSGKYVRQPGDVVLPNGVVANGSRGDIALGQVKLTIPIEDWGVKLPLSVTFANRTDLIRESKVRANFGFTFDLDPLFARFKPF